MIVLLHAPDPAFLKEASKRGVFAFVTDAEGEDWQSAIDIVLRRFTEYHNLKVIDVAAAVVDGHRLLPKQPG